jgi:hypothetical protein
MELVLHAALAHLLSAVPFTPHAHQDHLMSTLKKGTSTHKEAASSSEARRPVLDDDAEQAKAEIVTADHEESGPRQFAWNLPRPAAASEEQINALALVEKDIQLKWVTRA